MSTLRVTNLKGGSAGSAPNLPDGAVVTGVVTATSFSGSGANLTGIDATALKDSNGTVRVQANTTGAVVTGILTVSSSVSVGGTLTYEDVTNVDSVGMVTARTGIKVLAGGINAVGVVTATSFAGSGANLTGIDAAPTLDLVADGAIADAAAVFMHSNGKVRQVDISNYPAATGSAVDARASVSGTITNQWFNSCMIDATRFAICWVNGEIKVAVGEISGTTITFGAIANAGNGTNSGNNWPDICYDAQSGSLVITFQDNSSNRSSVQALSIGGSNTLTAGSVVYNSSGATYLNPIIFSDGKGGGLQVWKNGSNGDGEICAWTVSGNTVTLGGGLQPANNSLKSDHGTTSLCYHAQREVFLFAYVAGSDIFVDTVSRSGTSPTNIHSYTAGAGNNDARVDIAYSTVKEIGMVAYRDSGTWVRIRPIIVNASNQSSSPGTQLVSNSSTLRLTTTYQEQVDKFYVLDRNSSPSAALDIYICTANSSGATVDSEIANIGGNNDVRATLTSVGGGQIVQTLTDGTNSQVNSLVRQFAHSTQTITPTTSNFIGFSAGAYTDGQTAKIKIVGNTITKAGLTLLGQYYITGIGTISSTAGSPSIKAGMAISSNTLLIDPPYGS